MRESCAYTNYIFNPNFIGYSRAKRLHTVDLVTSYRLGMVSVMQSYQTGLCDFTDHIRELEWNYGEALVRSICSICRRLHPFLGFVQMTGI